MPTNDELELDDIDDASPTAPSDLRKYAQRQAAKAREAEALSREVAFLRAGIDTSKTLGKAFLATYDGDLNDQEAILEAAKEFPGIVRGTEVAPSGEADTSATAGSQVTTTDQTPAAPAPSGTEQRRALAGGASPAATAVMEPVEGSLAFAEDMMRNGALREQAMGEAIARQARALVEGKIPALGSDGLARR